MEPEVKEEIKRQIMSYSEKGGYSRPTVQDAQKIINMLGGDLKVNHDCQVETVCYYIMLLFLEKQTQS